MEISKHDVGLDLEHLELASGIAISEASAQHHDYNVECNKDSVNSSDSETSSGDDDDDDDASDTSSSSYDSCATDDAAEVPGRDKTDTVSCTDSRNGHAPRSNVTDSLSMIENTTVAAAAAASTAADDDAVIGDDTAGVTVAPAEMVCRQLSSLTVCDEQQVSTPLVTELPKCDAHPLVPH